MAASEEVPILDFLSQHLFLVLASSVALWYLCLGIYRLFFHPIAKFPGPKLAGLTYWYETYHDFVRRGKYTEQISTLHDKYGPIIRINPEELHVRDPKFIDTLYSYTSKRGIATWLTGPFDFEGTHFGSLSHDLHRTRRAPLQRLFSRSMVVKLEPLIKQNVVKLAKNVETWAGTGKPLSLVDAISCMATDIITEYCFGRSYGFLDDPNMEKSLYNAIHTGIEAVIPFRHFPLYQKLFYSLPTCVIEWMNPDMQLWREFRTDIRSHVRKIKQDIVQGVIKPSESSRATVFTEILTSNMPDSEKDTERLSREAQAMVQAGIETVSWSLTTNLTYLLSNPPALAKLRAELLAAIPDSSPPFSLPPWQSLEQLPYLSACVLEGLRLGYGVVTRLPRIPETETLLYTDERHSSSSPRGSNKTWAIPPGTPVGMSAYHVHHDESVFPDSTQYRPERWLDDDDGDAAGGRRGGSRRKKLEGCLLSFSKGSRQCVGMHLAHAELWLGLAMWVRWFGDRLELAGGCGVEDVRYHHDAFLPAVSPDSKVIKVLVKPKVGE
ncbi:cytochrome p450 [Diplodia corticola]|uniref:Cytochrome p450 n=1 Tax=Diplodia corticola TaxID=236234 RepID=A0A1J9QVN5_9PEZI|nr:cytochrome p450 [Diplodia corticola]OJD32058.1 cytochrome p450 [Diplodia corticola]